MRGLETKIPPVVLHQFFPFKFKRGLAGNHTNDRIRGCPPNRVSVCPSVFAGRRSTYWWVIIGTGKKASSRDLPHSLKG